MAAVEDTLRRINAHKGVLGVIIISPDGQPIRSTLEDKIATQLCEGLPPIFRQCRNAVRTLDPLNDLTYIRFNCKMYEILIAPTEVRPTPPSRGAPPLLCFHRTPAGTPPRRATPCCCCCCLMLPVPYDARCR